MSLARLLFSDSASPVQVRSKTALTMLTGGSWKKSQSSPSLNRSCITHPLPAPAVRAPSSPLRIFKTL